MPLGKFDLTTIPSWQKEKLLDRVRVREITLAELIQFDAWIQASREYPKVWCKDFGSFKIVGHELRFGTFLTREQSCFGEHIANIIEDWLPEI